MLRTRTQAWPDCRPLLADPDDLTLVFQPIVAAAEAGLAAELEALAIHKALDAVTDLPANTFLTVNVSPHILGSAPVQAALAARTDLHRVVVELTEHTPVHDLAALRLSLIHI